MKHTDSRQREVENTGKRLCPAVKQQLLKVMKILIIKGRIVFEAQESSVVGCM